MKRALAQLTVIVIALVVGAGVWNWYRPSPTTTITRTVEVPYVAEDAPEAREVERGVLPECPEIARLEPTPRQTKAIEKEIRSPLPEGEFLGLKGIKPLPYGGKAVLSLPSPNEDGGPREVVLTVVPNPQPFWEWTPERDLSVWVGYGGLDGGSTAGRLLGAEFRQGLFRSGPIRWEARSGVVHLFGGDTTWWVGVGARVRF